MTTQQLYEVSPQPASPAVKTRQCSGCEFFVRRGGAYYDRHECHRFPPSMRDYKSSSARWNAVGFVPVDENDWCGEYREHGR